MALIVLCALVYYFSYDNGRQDARAEAERAQRAAVALAEEQKREILRLENALAQCAPLAPGAQAADSRLPLRVGQSRLVFDNRLVLTLLEVRGTENMAKVQLNFINEEKIQTLNMGSGTSFKFSLGGRDWALLLSTLGQSSANFDIIETGEPLKMPVKIEPEAPAGPAD